MHENDSGHRSYVEKIRSDTQDYMKKILSDHEALCVVAAHMEGENERLHSDVAALQRELEEHRTREVRLRERLAEIREDSERDLGRFMDLEVRHTKLATLYVAGYQLRGTLDRQAVKEAIQEIVVNLIGSENFCVFEYDSSGRLELVCSVGFAGDDRMDLHAVESAIEGGELSLGSGVAADWVACVPLKVDGRVTGAIAIRSLLPQKKTLESSDFELFDLLANHAAIALYCTTLHELAQTAVPS